MNPQEALAMHTVINTFLGTLPVLFAVIGLIVRTENRITKIETLIKVCPNCPDSQGGALHPYQRRRTDKK